MRFPTLLATLALAVSCTNAGNPPAKPASATPAAKPVVAAPTTAAAAPAKPMKVDYEIPLAPLKQKDLRLDMYRNHLSLVFYFLPTCGHCQHTYPWIQKLRALYEPRGLAVAAIVSGSSTMDDIQMFDTDFKLDVPAFQDSSRKFGQLYGTGSVPLLMVVQPDGTYQSWTGSDDSTRVAVEAAIRTGLHIKK